MYRGLPDQGKNKGENKRIIYFWASASRGRRRRCLTQLARVSPSIRRRAFAENAYCIFSTLWHTLSLSLSVCICLVWRVVCGSECVVNPFFCGILECCTKVMLGERERHENTKKTKDEEYLGHVEHLEDLIRWAKKKVSISTNARCVLYVISVQNHF